MSNEQRGPIFLAVANPMQFVFAPFEMAIANICIGGVLIILLYLLLGLSPIWGFIFIILGHITLIVLGTRNPHLTTTLRATIRHAGKKPNLVGVTTGVKYVP